MNVGIIGCGLIGGKRSRALGAHRLVAAADVDISRARVVAREHPGATATSQWNAVIGQPNVECVIVSTTHDWLAPITLAAVRAGKHVLVEKPAARNRSELDAVIAAAKRRRVTVQVGFNHRFHPALRKAYDIFHSKDLGPVMFIRGRYGHGGRLGYNKEWRFKPKISGGGELLDQGAHLIDLSRWFLGDFVHVDGSVHTYFWDAPVEDNAFIMLRTARRQTAWLHASWTEWKNLFSFEVYTRRSKLHVEGLGGSYGVERLTFYQMSPKMGPPKTAQWEYPGKDESWRLEFDSFARAVHGGKKPEVGLRDARAVLGIVQKMYEKKK